MSDHTVRTAERRYQTGDITYEELLRIKARHGIIEVLPPGWLHAGSSHSHNTMGAFFKPELEDCNAYF